MATKNTTSVISAFAPIQQEDGPTLNSPFISECVKYATLSESREQLGASLKEQFKAILASTPRLTEAKAAKQLSTVLASALAPVVSHPEKRASEILVALGIRQRAPKAKSEDGNDKDADLAEIIEQLKELAKEQAGDKAISALRRAYLSLQAENKAKAE